MPIGDPKQFGGILQTGDGPVRLTDYARPDSVTDKGIAVGSVVQLRSGGPKLTVVRVLNPTRNGEGQWAVVVWFVDGERKWCEFPLASLVAVD